MFPPYRNQLTGFYMMGTLAVKGLSEFINFYSPEIIRKPLVLNFLILEAKCGGNPLAVV